MQENGLKVVSPGSLVKMLLVEADWSQTDLAHIIGSPPATINQIVNDKRPITAELAKLLGVAFDRSAYEFADTQTQWNLALAPEPDQEIKARALARSRFPIRAMAKRGWISASDQGSSLHGELCRFFGVNDLDSIGNIGFAAKKSKEGALTGEQMAWLYRVKQIAEEMVPEPFSPAKLLEAVDSFTELRGRPDAVRFIPRLLNKAGVRFVVCEALPGSQIDGVCFWLDHQSPVIGMSLRFDRLDNFWFVLRHECAHVLHGHGKDGAIIDADLDSEVSINDEERLANADAANFCVPSEQLNSFYLRKRPFFAEREVLAFAKRMKVHPGLVVGQLQRRMGRYDFLRKHLVKVRDNLGSAMMMDGWGDLVPVG
jgi:HTH-type transcriptional regulator / antitoxin HigA